MMNVNIIHMLAVCVAKKPEVRNQVKHPQRCQAIPIRGM